MNIERLTELSEEINAWAGLNFKVHYPALGILEEIGEASRCVLKQRQGIRGFDDPVLFKIEFLDALCDLCVYTLHGVALDGIKLETSYPYYPGATDELFLAHLAGLAGTVLLNTRTSYKYQGEPHSMILAVASDYAQFHGFDLWPELEKVWAKVKSRDWKTNPQDADKKELAYPATPNIVCP